MSEAVKMPAWVGLGDMPNEYRDAQLSLQALAGDDNGVIQLKLSGVGFWVTSRIDRGHLRWALLQMGLLAHERDGSLCWWDEHSELVAKGD